ncbi:MAG: hypothetical protein RMY34_02940 [Aulosira sp. DedQUE10]|nr:hypothetical protein [Aulosira sp. DedQUE10]
MIKKIIGKIQKWYDKILFPEFLNKINHSWLLHRPRLWLIKLHYVVYYALLINVIIFFLVLIFPIKVYHLCSFLIVGIVIIAIGEVIALIYWLYKQSLYNIEKQYGNTCKSNGFLELFGYSACIMLIASVTLVFYLSVALKSAIVIPQTDLSIDLLILNSINRKIEYIDIDGAKDFVTKIEQNKFKTLNEYLELLRVYEIKLTNKQKRKSIFFNEDYFIQEKQRENSFLRGKFNRLYDSEYNQSLQLFLLENKKLRDFLKSSISIETLRFIEFDETPSFTQTTKIFNYLLNKKEFKSIKNSIA